MGFFEDLLSKVVDLPQREVISPPLEVVVVLYISSFADKVKGILKSNTIGNECTDGKGIEKTNISGTKVRGRKTKKEVSNIYTQRLKRGQYAAYGPTLRAEIARFAKDHTNQVESYLTLINP